MIHWKRLSVFRLLIPLIIGIHFQRIGLLLLSQQYLLFSIGILATTIYLFPSLRYSRRFVKGILIQILFVLLGSLLVIAQASRPIFDQKHLPKQCIVTIEEIGQTKSGKTKAIGKIRHSSINLTSYKMQLFFPGNETISLGDTVVVSSRISLIESSKNPGEFDYQKMMRSRAIYFQSFLSHGEFSIHSSRKKSLLSYWQQAAEERLNDVDSALQGVAKSLLLGNRTDLDDKVKRSFQDSGTMHILAVSGLHVGIIYLFAFKIILLLSRYSPWLRKHRYVFLIVIIWAYALFTGMSTSVIRSAIMFSMLAFSKYAFPSVHSLNTLASAALLLLLVDNNFLADVGFQLSFLAVSGIIIILPQIRRYYLNHHVLIVYILDLFFVSLCAQLATAGISIHYFNQFPTLGLLTNFYAIPLAFTIIFSGFIYMLTADVPILSQLVLYVLETALTVLQNLNAIVSDLEFALLDELYLTEIQVLLIYLFLISIASVIQWPTMRSVLVSLCIVLLSILQCSIRSYTIQNQNTIIIHSSSKATIVQQIVANQSIIYSNTDIDSTFYHYSIKPYHLVKGVEDVQFRLMDHESDVVRILLEKEITVFIKPKDIGVIQNKDSNLIISQKWRYNNDGIHYLNNEGAIEIDLNTGEIIQNERPRARAETL